MRHLAASATTVEARSEVPEGSLASTLATSESDVHPSRGWDVPDFGRASAALNLGLCASDSGWIWGLADAAGPAGCRPLGRISTEPPAA